MTPARAWYRRLRLLAGTLIAGGLLLACGGGEDKPQASAEATVGRAQAQSVAAPVDLSVVSLTKVSERRVGRTVFDYVFRVTVHNNSEPLVAVTASIGAAGQGTSIVDGEVLVGDMAAGATITPADTVTLRQDRTFPFNPTALVWRFRSIPAAPAIVPGATLSNAPAGRASVGSPYETALRLMPVDGRNAITSLQVSNPTPGGASPRISLQGLLTWTPNEADFATTTLHVGAGLQDGSSSSFDVPVTVTKHRLVANVALNGAGRYSDPEGRYLVEVAGATPGASITGTLSISERYQLSGAFSSEITSSDSSHVIEVITAPMGVPFDAVAAGAASSSRQRALAAGNGRQRRFSAALSGAYAEPIMGSNVDTGINLYSTRQRVPHFKDVEVARIEANCSILSIMNTCDDARLASATPVILVHGFTLESSGLGGGQDTWATLGSKLDGLGHPVFELRWRTLMRFEEAAGLLVKLGRRVSDATGRKPFIIAHSFGGVVAHLALAGKAIAWNDDTRKWETLAAGSNQAPLFDGLVTLASPLSGINDDDSRRDFVLGRYSGDRSINACGQVTCAQAGAFDMIELNSLQRNVAVVKSRTGARPASGSDSDLKTGESIASIHEAWSSGAIALPVTKVHTVIALRERPFDDYTPDLNSANAYLLGDGLISMIGQSVLPSDFTCDSNITDPKSYNFPGCIDPVLGDFLRQIDDGFVAHAPITFVYAKLGARKYYFASRAAHTDGQVGIGNVLDSPVGVARYETRPYRIAQYQDEVVVGEDAFGSDYRGAHPLRFFIDNVLKRGNPTLAPRSAVTATVRGVVSIDGVALDLRSVPAWRSIVRYDGELPVRPREPVALDAAGNFSFDAAAWLRAELGPDVVLSDYRIRMEFGDGVVAVYDRKATDRLSNSTASYDLGAIRLTLVLAQAPLVDITGTVATGVSAQPITAADVWLARGVNMVPGEVRGWPDSNAARHVSTDANGAFSVAGLRAGEYTLLVSRSGFADVLLGRVNIAAGQVIRVVMWPGTGASALNDTGVGANQCYAAGSNVLLSCGSAAALALNDRQDGMLGRDVTNNDDGNGRAGFAFSLVPRAGGGYYDKTECVRDNVTGLIWEGKTASGERAGSITYTNWGDARAGDAGAYAAWVNASRLCGFTDWRLPDRWELQGIVDYGIAYPGPTIDATWFPNTLAWPDYWTSSPYVGYADYAWYVYFSLGNVNFDNLNLLHVRLVR